MSAGAREPEVLEGRSADVGGLPVRRLLPHRPLRTVGAWCFVDHLGPLAARDGRMAVGPHPHCGLQTVTWLLDGEDVHVDSLGSEQPVRPGRLALMTAGAGVAHAEDSAPTLDRLHGVQLWVAQPEATRHGPASFDHHADLPQVELAGATATVLTGALADAPGARSPARVATPLLGAELRLRGRCEVALDASYEHAVVVLEGQARVGDRVLVPGALAHLPPGREVLPLDGAGVVLLLGGVPFDEPLLVWWNLVARTREEVEAAAAAWNADDGRFGTVRSALPRIAAPPVPWRRAA